MLLAPANVSWVLDRDNLVITNQPLGQCLNVETLRDASVLNTLGTDVEVIIKAALISHLVG